MKLKKMVEGLNQKLWSESFGVKLNDKRLLYSIRYHSNGTLAIVADWVLNDFDQPEEFVIETLGDLDKNTQNYLLSQIGSKTSENRFQRFRVVVLLLVVVLPVVRFKELLRSGPYSVDITLAFACRDLGRL